MRESVRNYALVGLALLVGAGCNRKSNANDPDTDAAGFDGEPGDGVGGAGGAAGAMGGRGGSGIDAAASEGGGGGTGGTAPACNALVDDAPAVREGMIGGAQPLLAGGIIPDGTYVLAERYQYVLSCECLVRAKLVVGGGGTTIQTFLRIGTATAERTSGTMSTNQNIVSWDLSCPETAIVQHQYNVITGGGVVALQTLDGSLHYELWVAGRCNTFANEGPVISGARIAAAPPASTGGTLVDGIYLLTRREIYTGFGGASGPTDDTRKATLVISNVASGTMTMSFATSIDGAGDTRERYSGVAPSSSVSTFAVTRACPPVARINVSGFTAAGSTLVLVNDNNGEVDTWTRR